MERGQGLFWGVAGGLTAGTVVVSIFAAFYGGTIIERVVGWRERRRRRGWRERERESGVAAPVPLDRGVGSKTGTFEVLGATRPSFVDLLAKR